MKENTLIRRGARFIMGVAIISFTVAVIVHGGDGGSSNPRFHGQLGPHSKKVRTEGGKTYLWASGEPGSPDAEWYDFTDSPIPTAELQYGIGKDSIRAVDDPLFVKPDDPRLAKLPPSPYSPRKRETNNDLMVIGYVANGEARAYPTALLDHHELVNDRIGGKPVTVGW